MRYSTLVEVFDAVVVGAGPNGLSAAIALAQAGRSVAVFEADDTPGGGARTAELTLPGYRHDVCSAIHPMGVASPFWRTLPLEKYGLEWIHPDAPFAHPLDDGPAAMAFRSVDDTAAGLGIAGVRYRALFEPFIERWEALFGDVMGPLGIPRHPIVMARFGLRAMRTANAVGRKLGDARASALFAGLAAHAVLPFDRLPSAAIGLMIGIAAHAVGWPLPRGGSQSITTALIGHLESLGGKVVTGHPVASIDELPTSGTVLLDLSPRGVVGVAGAHLPAGYVRRLERYRHGPGSFKVDMALDGPIPWRDPACARAGTVHLGGTLEEIAAAEGDVWKGRHPERPYVLLAQQSLFDPTRAPEGHHTVYAYCHVPSGSDRDLTGEVESQIERFAPGFRDRILARYTRTAQGFEEYNANYVGGDINGGAPFLDQLFTRPVARLVPYSTPNPRVFLCSASTPPGAGVHGMGGWHAARAALARS